MKISLDDLLKGHGAQFTSDVLREAFEQEKVESSKALVAAARTVLSHGEKAVQNLLNKVREIRRTERQVVDELKKTSAAFEHFKLTGVPFPYYLALYGQKDIALRQVQRVFQNTNIDWENLPDEVWNLPSE